MPNEYPITAEKNHDIISPSLLQIYGLDSYTGQIVWSLYIPELEPFSSGNRLLLYLQRSTAHFPHQPYTTVIAAHKNVCLPAFHRRM